MRRLHPRGAANKGICVDAEGAMLGPDCVLVHRTSRGFRGIERDHAAALQKCAVAARKDHNFLFHQTRRIAEALDKGEIALAQIYGLHIPVVDLDDGHLARISGIDFAGAYNPNEPRIPKGNPHGGEWTTGRTSDAQTDSSEDGGVAGGGSVDDSGSGDDGGDTGEDGYGGHGEGGGDNGENGDGADGNGGGDSPPASGDN
ncbi:MAG TPA: hypothetical protein VK432_00300, partial [Stellaceae bacterium]|nr:hypothetical protein [Stellaceae bacterium]